MPSKTNHITFNKYILNSEKCLIYIRGNKKRENAVSMPSKYNQITFNKYILNSEKFLL